MIWTLIILVAFSDGGGFRHGGQGGLTSETLDFGSKEECEAAGQEIRTFYETDGGTRIDTAWTYEIRGIQIVKHPKLASDGKPEQRVVRADGGKDWMAKHLTMRYTCIQRKPIQTKR